MGEEGVTMSLYKKIKHLKIEMEHENGEDICVVFIRPEKMQDLLDSNEFLKALAEKLDKKEECVICPLPAKDGEERCLVVGEGSL